MTSIKTPGMFTGAGIFSAVAASLCCLTPVMALVAGSSSAVVHFSRIEPARPYLVGLTIAIFSYAWYRKLLPASTSDVDCTCEKTKVSFFQTKKFLLGVTLLSLVMMSFPMYAHKFYPESKGQSIKNEIVANQQHVNFAIHGMSCAGCELEVNQELSKVGGILAYQTSYLKATTQVIFDPSKTSLKDIEAAIQKTGYQITSYEVVEYNNPKLKNTRSTQVK